ncbi:MAG TPA: hypothetical protein VGM56_14785 [Byssovorax sp.]
MRRPGLAASCLVAALMIAPAARAQTDPAVAEKLFREGKALFDKKEYPEACAKLAESQRLDPASGTLLALAVCHEAEGKLATAWGEYTNTVSLSHKDGNPKREKAAAARAALIEPKLSYVTFEVAPASATLDGLVLKRDGTVLGAASWHDVPIDPGEHTVDVTAPGKKPYTAKFTVDGHSTTVNVPGLADAPKPPPPPPPPPPFPWRTVGFVTAGVGLATLVVGSVLGGVAIAKSSDAKSRCTESICTDAGAIDENNTAGGLADTSTAMFVVGLLVGGGGAAIVLLNPPPKTPAKAGFTFAPGPGDVGASVGWRF